MNSGPTPPILIQDGDCQPGSSITQFRTRIEATGQTADIVVTTYPAKKMDLFRVYLMDGKNTVLDSTGRSVIVGKKRVFDPVFFVVRASPSTGPFRIIVYEEASLKKPIFAMGSIAKFDAALVRAELDFDAHALDPDCPAASTRGG